MKKITGVNRALTLTLLVALLIFPNGMNKKAMANTTTRVYLVQPEKKLICNDEEEYSVSVIKILSWI